MSASERERVPHDVCDRGARGVGVQESASVLHNSVGRCQAWSTRVHINPVREVQRDV
jgi:hypothetical protein